MVFFNYSSGEVIRVASAANLQFALKDIIKLFEEKYPELKVYYTLSSSGKLSAQILKGAPFDIFLSANMKYPEFLYKKGLTVGKPVIFAYGSLVLWSMKNIPLKKEKIKVLLKVKKISIPNPKYAPYGKEAINVLKNYHLLNKVKTKLVFGDSVLQSTQYIYRKLVDVGFTSKSVVLSPFLKGKGKWIELDRKSYSPIKQGIVLLKNGKNKKYAKLFMDFILSDEGRRILKKYGYYINE